MNYKEYITAVTARFNFSETDNDILFENQKNIIPDLESEVDVKTAKNAIVREIANLIPLYNVSEGGYSVSWNIEALKMWYNLTCKELGLIPEGTAPTVKKVDVW